MSELPLKNIHVSYSDGTYHCPRKFRRISSRLRHPCTIEDSDLNGYKSLCCHFLISTLEIQSCKTVT
jgi:hypothetical protein